ncbi:hypothetical protein ACR9LH_06645 [Helicobacter pylori]
MHLFEKWQSVTDAYKSFYEEAGKHLLKKQINKAKECLSLVKQYRDNKCAVWIEQEHRKRFYLY